MIEARRFSLYLVLALGLLLPSTVQAFCGFYVGGADTKVYNNATMVTMMREGKTTVLSMGNNYQGPPEDFAMVVPVPVVLQKDNVKILPKEVFARLDKMAAPRLVEYWEQDPCPLPQTEKSWGTIGYGSGTGAGSGYGIAGTGNRGTTVVVEAKFAVGEYEVVILSAEDATGLERWLTEEGYKIPAGAAPFLRPYVEKGSKFFVAKVNPSKVTFKDGMASLSPLRFHYQSDDFSLPVRLGLINAKDKQDLVVHILAKNKRYELANYKNLTIPTNLFVKDEVRERFGEFYAALFDATLEKNPGSVITEYAWSANSCDPCPEPTLTMQELKTLGLDVIEKQGLAPGIGIGHRNSPSVSSAQQGAPARPGPGGRPSFGQLRPTNLVSRIRMGQIVVTGELDKNIVRRYIRRVTPRLRACYDMALAKNKKLAGEVVASYVIGKDGLPAKTKITGINDKQLRTCFASTFGSIQYPKPRGDSSVRVTQPLQLSSEPLSARTGIGTGFGFGGISGDWVLTRLHARYDQKSLGEDLVFQEAQPISGGRGGGDDSISKTAEDAGANTFQGRYIIRHPWEGEVACDNPRRGVWGAPPSGVTGNTAAKPATDLAFAARGGATLASMLGEPVPASADVPARAAVPTPATPSTDETAPTSAPPKESPPKKDSGCSTTGSSAWPGLLLVLLALVRRRRRLR